MAIFAPDCRFKLAVAMQHEPRFVLGVCGDVNVVKNGAGWMGWILGLLCASIYPWFKYGGNVLAANKDVRAGCARGGVFIAGADCGRGVHEQWCLVFFSVCEP